MNFIEDRTNADTRLARSYLRARVLPLLAERWPQTAEQLARSARHSAQALQLLDEVAAADLAMCGAPAGGLAISALAALSPPRRVNLLRHWLRTRGVRAPAEYVLDQILANVERLPRSGHACVRWPDAEVRRYRDTLVVVAPAIAPADGWESAWDVAVPLAIPGTGLRLRAHETVGAGLAQARVRQRELRVRLRRGGEWCRLPGRAHRHRLKKLLQQAGVPPWERARMPLIYVDGELAAVADRWVCAPYAARAGEPGYLLVLDDAPPAT